MPTNHSLQCHIHTFLENLWGLKTPWFFHVPPCFLSSLVPQCSRGCWPIEQQQCAAGASSTCSSPSFSKGLLTALWQVLEKRVLNLAQSLCPGQPFPFSVLWRSGSAGLSRAKRRIGDGIDLLPHSLSHTWAQIAVPQGDLCYQWYAQIGTKRNNLACLGPDFSSPWDSSALRRANAMKFSRRAELALWHDSLPKDNPSDFTATSLLTEEGATRACYNTTLWALVKVLC